MTQTGLKELVYNDFHIGEDCDVTIVAGCGIHNSGDKLSEHSGIHSFFVGRNAKIKYVEKHYGSGEGTGERVMNPETVVTMDEGSYMEMDTVQIRGVDSTNRVTKAKLGKGAQLVIKEKTDDTWKTKSNDKFLCRFGRRGFQYKMLFRVRSKRRIRTNILFSYSWK